MQSSLIENAQLRAGFGAPGSSSLDQHPGSLSAAAFHPQDFLFALHCRGFDRLISSRMTEEETQAAKRAAQLRRKIEEHDRRYYQEAAPIISDREYDRLYQELLDLETQFPQFVSTDSPTQRVGGKPLEAFAQIGHRVPMLSLDNTYSEKEVASFYARITRLLPNERIPVVIEPKVDGVAVSLLYENGGFGMQPRAEMARWATISRKILRPFVLFLSACAAHDRAFSKCAVKFSWISAASRN